MYRSEIVKILKFRLYLLILQVCHLFYVRVDSKEVLLDDSREFARKAKLQGVDVQLDIWTGMWHAWTVVPFVPESKTALKKAGYWLGQRA